MDEYIIIVEPLLVILEKCNKLSNREDFNILDIQYLQKRLYAVNEILNDFTCINTVIPDGLKNNTELYNMYIQLVQACVQLIKFTNTHKILLEKMIKDKIIEELGDII